MPGPKRDGLNKTRNLWYGPAMASCLLAGWRLFFLAAIIIRCHKLESDCIKHKLFAYAKLMGTSLIRFVDQAQRWKRRN